MGGSNDPVAIALLFVRNRRVLPQLGRGFLRKLDARAANGEIGIVEGAASGWTRGHFDSEPSSPASTCASDTVKRKNRTVVAIDRNPFIIAVGNRARGIHQARTEDRSHNVH